MVNWNLKPLFVTTGRQSQCGNCNNITSTYLAEDSVDETNLYYSKQSMNKSSVSLINVLTLNIESASRSRRVFLNSVRTPGSEAHLMPLIYLSDTIQRASDTQ